MSKPQPRIEEILPLSPFQEGLYFHAGYDRDAPDAYNVQYLLDLEGALDPGLLREAARLVLHRHSSLRTSYRQRSNGETVQIVQSAANLSFTELDLSAKPEREREQELAAFLGAERTRRFDLGRAPLIRFALVRLTEDRHCLALMNHHILLDGWSMPILLQELFTHYASGSTSADEDIRPAAGQYRDYLGWLAEQDREAAERAWRTYLDGLSEGTFVLPDGETGSTAEPARVTLTLDEEQLS
ncbi:condensation domain-containing protein, partial [Streptomyces sp. ADI93-02]|uniref:condensation domain-containing protein n=1 Tax=Streptomyces sp. ADI93-02 TaxID=1522757 RepID=UPI001F1558CA